MTDYFGLSTKVTDTRSQPGPLSASTALLIDVLSDSSRSLVRGYVGWPRIEFTPEEVRRAYTDGRRRNRETQAAGYPENRHDVRRNAEEINITGALGELAYAKWSGLKPNPPFSAADFPDGTDVKASEHSAPNLLVVQNKKKRPGRYVLIKIAESSACAWLVGWIGYKRFVRERSPRRMQGKRGKTTWFIPYQRLNPMEGRL